MAAIESLDAEVVVFDGPGEQASDLDAVPSVRSTGGSRNRCAKELWVGLSIRSCLVRRPGKDLDSTSRKFPIPNGGEPAALYSWIFLLIGILGPGAFALDALRRRR